MGIFYSPSTGGFYDDTIHTHMPLDAVQIDEATRARLLAAQSTGSAIGISGGQPVAVQPTVDLQEEQTTFIKKIDSDVDAIYGAVVGHRLAEYQLAEDDAQAYKDAGYTGTAPQSVQCWATAKNKTAQWAADDILATAAAWLAAQLAIRQNRLTCKETARNAAKSVDLTAVQTVWNGFLITIRAQLGI